MLKKIVDGKEIECTPEEESEIRAAWAKNESEFKATQYIDKRISEYGTWQSQLDEIYHDGIDSWKGRIQSIKIRYPKT